jgi:hypothetical protein
MLEIGDFVELVIASTDRVDERFDADLGLGALPDPHVSMQRKSLTSAVQERECWCANEKVAEFTPSPIRGEVLTKYSGA